MFQTLRSKLLVLILFITIIPMLLIGTISYTMQKNNLINHLEEIMMINGASMSSKLHALISERLKDVQYLAQNPILKNEESSGSDIGEQLQYFSNFHDMFFGTIFVDTNGIVRADTGSPLLGRDVSERQWFRESMEGNAFMTDLFLSPVLQHLVLVLSAPVYNEDEQLIGVVSPYFDFENLNKMIQNYTKQQEVVGSFGYSFLINSNGDIISSPENESLLNMNYFDRYGITMQDIEDHLGGSNPSFLEMDGELHSFSKVGGTAEFQSNWYLGFAVTKETLYAPLSKLLNYYIILFGIVLIITIIIAIRLSTFIVKPVESLVQKTNAFAAGTRLTTECENTFKEIQNLNEKFEHMMDTLEDREKDLIRSEKLKVVGQMSAGFAHEIRNPLTTIRGFVQLLKLKDGKLDYKYFDLIISEIDRVNGIVDDLLNIANPKQECNQIKESDVEQLLCDVVSLYQAPCNKKGISINVDCSKNLPIFYLAENKLKQVLINFIQNSIEALENKQNAVITILSSFEPKHSQLVISVKDNGNGMDKKTLEKLGTPFFTLKETGTGLGLTISYKMIEEMNGTIHVASELGKGTTFTLTIPVITK